MAEADKQPRTKFALSHCRVSGVLLHPTSLPGPYGIGDLGPSAFEFVEFLEATGQQIWQILPLGPTGFGNSPYMCYSALAGNPLLVSLEALRDEGWLTEEDLASAPDFPARRVDYEAVKTYKLPLLKVACDRFHQQATPAQKDEFTDFCEQKANWLDDYVLFMAIKADQGGSSWSQWEKPLADRDPAALAAKQRELAAAIRVEKFQQFLFYRQWMALKAYANDRGVFIMGDIPIYVAQDSADVWARRENFSLDVDTWEPAAMAGVPPDYFSATGQLWGNPVYNWGRLRKTGFAWWIERFRAILDYVDFIRIDHFRGFEAFWAVPKGESTAMKGRWVKAPGAEFFEILRQELGELPLLAEDLGVITPAVEALRDRFEFPGMRVLHFAFGSDPANPFLPFNFGRNTIVYAGTHDNDTTVGWFEQLNDYERDNVRSYLGGVGEAGINWDLMRLALSSIANVAVLTVQDLLGLGTDCRMNFPGRITPPDRPEEGYWEWRYQPEQLTQDIRDRLSRLTWLFGRGPAWWD